MVNFENNGFIIRVETSGNPIEDWLNTHDELVDLFQCQDVEMTNGKKYYNALKLLRSMMPDYQTATKMLK